MSNTNVVYARVDANLKEHAESILAKLGITPSGAVQMLYSKIVLIDGMPFDLVLPRKKPTCIGGMTKEEVNAEIWKGINSIKSGKLYTEDEVEKLFVAEPSK